MSARHRVQLSVAPPFELRLALFGHGWIDLAPHRFDAEQRTFTTALLLAGHTPLDVAAVASQGGVRADVTAPRWLTRQELATVRRTLRWMLRTDEALAPFWEICRKVPRLRWVAERGAGRMLRSASVFEDLLKLLFTTNCSWAATRLMTARTVEGLGEPTALGRRTFPTATACAAAGETFFRAEVRAGYRAGACHRLAAAFAEGTLRDADFTDPTLSAAELRARLLGLPGFGPYAAGQALRLLGHHEDLALDSWCRGKLARLRGRLEPPSDRTIEREYRSFGSYKGLALWMDLTADWHRAP